RDSDRRHVDRIALYRGDDRSRGHAVSPVGDGDDRRVCSRSERYGITAKRYCRSPLEERSHTANFGMSNSGNNSRPGYNIVRNDANVVVKEQRQSDGRMNADVPGSRDIRLMKPEKFSGMTRVESDSTAYDVDHECEA